MSNPRRVAGAASAAALCLGLGWYLGDPLLPVFAALGAIGGASFTRATRGLSSARPAPGSSGAVDALGASGPHLAPAHAPVLAQAHAVDPSGERDLKSLGILAGGIAHDFNNLLTGILGNTNLALGELPAGAARDAVRDADTAARRARELVAQILAYSGRGRLELRPVNLSALVEETASLLRGVIAPRTTLTVSASRGATIEADPAQVRQVVMNLVTNGSEALGNAPGDVCVRVYTEALDRAALDATVFGAELPPGSYVRLEVADTGCGMDAETVARMFEPYFTTKYGGRGLGLAALLGIVRHHRGTVRVDSVPGDGTVIRVWFPEAEGAARSEADTEPPTLGHRAGTVLLVEDDEMVRRVATRMLAKLGYDVLAARDGHDGIRILDEDRGDVSLALVDVQMPGVDGRGVLRAMRQRRPEIPVVLMTGYAGDEIVPDAIPDAWLRKPFSVRDLVTALDSATRASELSLTGPPAPPRR